ncbi:MAG: hypothetical protein AB7F74_06455 [Parvibaculaceae bacterium]
MSDEYHRPTYTSEKGDNGLGLYNPTQVRLYGIMGPVPPMASGPSITISSTEAGAEIKLDLKDEGKVKKDIANLLKVLEALKDNPRTSIIAEAEKYWRKDPNATAPKKYELRLELKDIGASIDLRTGASDKMSSGIMFGYAYEGHAYDFPKPKIMFVPSQPIAIPVDDTAYYAKAALGYKVWIVDKLEKCIEIEVNQGFIDELVLEANMPGKRSPTAYRAAMMLSHRGGRLTE